MRSSSSAQSTSLWSAACCLRRVQLMSLAAGAEYFPSHSSCNSVGESGSVVSMINELSLVGTLMGGRRRWVV
jgi:hypothetical protein